MNIKKIIAREGLIIVGIAVIALTSLLMPTYLVVKNIPVSTADLQNKTQLKITDTENGTTYTILTKKGLTSTQEAAMRELCRRGKLESIESLTIVKKEISLARYTNILLAFSMLVYPLYLLIRFIIWAVKTLKKRS